MTTEVITKNGSETYESVKIVKAGWLECIKNDKVDLYPPNQVCAVVRQIGQ